MPRAAAASSAPPAVVVGVDALATLVDVLRADGRTVVGPTVRDRAIVYDEIEGAADLPAGWGDVQEPGSYRIRRRDDDARFGFASGPTSWKRFLFPPRHRLWGATRTDDGFALDASEPVPAPLALLGVRACDLHAIAVQDRVFLGGTDPDAVYAARRRDALVIAVQCGAPAATCFCTSMGTGPRADAGFDLALTELLGPGRHELLVEAGTDRGGALLGRLGGRAATAADHEAAEAVTRGAAAAMGRRMDTTALPGLLTRNPEHPRWDDVAERCLACGNCTLACPTCFCNRVEDVTDLTGAHAERWRSWDSCFTLDFAYLHGGTVRTSVRARYRQWLTHKLDTWFDQLGSSGCVGCGRCITWCPVGIDITEELAAIAASDGAVADRETER